MKFTVKMVVALLLAALFLLAAMAFSLRTFQQVVATSAAQRHKLMVLNAADDFLSAIRDAETGGRGYVITGNEAFLQPYLAVRDGMQDQLQQLQHMVQDSASQKQLQVVTPLVNAKMAHIAQTIALRRANDIAGAARVVADGQGMELMDAIRARFKLFTQLEEAALVRNEADYQATLRNLFGLMVGASVLALCAALTFAYLLYRQGQQRQDELLHRETRQLLERQHLLNQQLQDANQTLQRSEEQLAVTLHSIGDGVITTDARALVTNLNPLAEQLTGWTLEQARGRLIGEVLQMVHKGSRALVANPVMDALQFGTVQELANHTVLLARDGHEYDIADSCAPILARDGRVIGAVLVFRNVTEEYAAQQASRDSAVLIQTILNTVADGVLTLHGQSLLVETVNPAMEDLFGYAAADMVGQDIRRLIPQFSPLAVASDADITDALGTALATPAIALREVQGLRKDGSLFSLEIALSEMWLGGERHYTGVLRDYTTHKLAEEALFKEGALQTAIFNSANFSCIATDAKGVIQIFNVGAERMLGYAASDVVNKITPAAISDPQEVIARAKSLSAEFDTAITPGFEALVFKASRGIEDICALTYIRQDGSRFPAVVSVTALRDDADAIIGYLLIGYDNAARQQVEEERKKLDQRLRDQQFYTRSLIESNIDALMTTDPAGIITDVNKQMESLTDCTRDELIGAPFKKYFTDPERAEAAIKLALNDKKVTNYELTARTRNGLETVVSCNATTFYDRDRKLQGVFAAARDVTERRRLDGVLEDKNVELEAARALAEKANLAKSDFLSSMSHELRSPLNAILGFAQLMESDTPAPGKSQQDSISQILRAGWHLLKLINEILDLSKIESRQIPLSQEPVQLGDVLGECQGMCEPQAQQRGIAMHFPVIDKALFVLADHTRLKQVFINLLTNAIKYNRYEGTIEVRCTLQPQARVRVSIRDTGLGLCPDQQAQLFQAFNRLGQEAGGVEGTGIGLVVAKQLVELMGGTIGVESTVGEGSVFWFELGTVDGPLLLQDSSHASLSLPRVTRPARERTLLYVEDNPANMKLVQKIMERHPEIRLLTANTGLAGIALARAELPDVLLLDINLPGINGFETLKLLREDPLTAHIPALAISANAMRSDIKKGQEAGFLRYLTKPIKVDEFMLALNTALEHAERGKRSGV